MQEPRAGKQKNRNIQNTQKFDNKFEKTQIQQYGCSLGDFSDRQIGHERIFGQQKHSLRLLYKRRRNFRPKRPLVL